MIRVMASPTPTPGALLKLLHSMNSKSPENEHERDQRSAPTLLQVISIVPALSEEDEATRDDKKMLSFWPKRGFYVKISDTMYSTYVSLTEQDNELILTDNLQLGQLVYVDSLEFASASHSHNHAHQLPRVKGLKTLPGRHSSPCLGNPQDLVIRHDGLLLLQSSSQTPKIGNSLPNPGSVVNLHQLDLNLNSNPNPKPFRIRGSSGSSSSNVQEHKAALTLAPGSEMEGEKAVVKPKVKPKGSRDASPSVSSNEKKRSSRGRSCSPIPPSKCVVPSLARAQEERDKDLQPTGSSGHGYYVVPSRYRQPSPTASSRRTPQKGSSSSPMVAHIRRASISPGRRLSPCVVGLSSAKKKKDKEKTVETKADGDSASNADCGGKQLHRESESNSPSKSNVDIKGHLRSQPSLSRRLSDAKEENQTRNEVDIKDAPFGTKVTIPSKSSAGLPADTCNKSLDKPQIVIHDKKWTDGSVSWHSVSATLSDLGQEAMKRRNLASVAAAEALQEASAAEAVIRCLSMFSDLCSSAKPDNPHPSIDRFFEIYNAVSQSMKSAEALATKRVTDDDTDESAKEHDDIYAEKAENSYLWIGAALATDLASLSLFSNHKFNSSFKNSIKTEVSINNKSDQSSNGQDSQELSTTPVPKKSTAALTSSELYGRAVLSSLQHPTNDRRHSVSDKVERGSSPVHGATGRRLSGKTKKNFTQNKTKTSHETILKGSGKEGVKGSTINETVKLSQNLYKESRKWFLKFVENSLEAGFPVENEENNATKRLSQSNHNAQIAAMLSQLKKVNDWLSELVQQDDRENDNLEESIEDLRRKIYSFLLKHVESAASALDNQHPV